MAKIPINISSGTIDKQKDIIVGIDLGTTNSLIAYPDENGEPIILRKDGSSGLLPSVIYFNEDNQPQVGAEALRMAIRHPERTILSVKRLMGKSWNDVREFKEFFAYDIIEREEEELIRVRLGQKFFTPTELSAIILKELKAIGEAELGQTISKAVITVPAYFNDSQRQATKDAGKLAGLDVLRIINEPTAASLAFGLANDAEDKTVAVYDLGGGTFDISILRLANGIFEVLSTHGDTFLGGDDFDRALANHWRSILDEQQVEYNFQELRLLAEEAKRQLTDQDHYSGTIKTIELTIDRSTFAERSQSLIQRTINACERALADAGLEKEQLDEVILVGGSTRMPIVAQSLETFFNKKVNRSINPDEAVAKGAALQADILSGRRKDMLLLDVTPLSLGIETMGGLMDTIIPRNSKIPTAVGRNYTTSIDGQRNLRVTIYQGERDLVEHNRKLGEFILRNIPSMAAGIPKIEIKFLIDADGILQVIATELRSGVKQEIEVRPQYGISEDEMAKMLIESISHAEEDVQQRALIEAKTEARMIIQSSHRFLRQNENWLTDSQANEINLKVKALEKTVEGDDKDAVLHSMEELNEYTRPLAHQALDKNIAEGIHGKEI